MSLLKFSKFLGALFLCGLTLAKEVVITNTAGKSLNVRLLNFEDNQVEIQSTKNGQKFILPMSSLNDDSQQTIKQWVDEGGHLSTKFEVSFSSKSVTKTKTVVQRNNNKGNNNNRNNNNRNNNGNNNQQTITKTVTLDPIITIENDSLKGKPTKPVTLQVIIAGRDYQDSTAEVQIYHNQDYKIPSLGKSEEQTIEIGEISKEYGTKNRKNFGSKYYGYGIILSDGSDIIYSKFVPSLLEKKVAFELPYTPGE